MNSPVWQYYKIYVGQSAGRLDHIVTHLLPEIVDHSAVETWFFLRFTDEGGAHLRLRLGGSPSAADGFRRAIDPLVHRIFRDVPVVVPSRYRPVVVATPKAPARPRLSSRAPVDPCAAARIEIADYEPEVEVFGETGIAVAETLFCASSETAMRVLIDEEAGRYSRKTVVPLLMAAVADAFVPGRPAAWGDYARYWLAGDSAAGTHWRQRFVDKAAALRVQGTAVLAPDEALVPEALDVVRYWRVAVAAAADGFSRAGDREPPGAFDLMSHFTHLMNNRLGLMPLEEAYFATLIEHVSGPACLQ